jgi:hypothetical protein
LGGKLTGFTTLSHDLHVKIIQGVKHPYSQHNLQSTLFGKQRRLRRFMQILVDCEVVLRELALSKKNVLEMDGKITT